MREESVRNLAVQCWHAVANRWPTPLLFVRKHFGVGNAVIFHIGRSGSTVLCDLLDQHSRILCDREIFHGYYGEAYRVMGERGLQVDHRWNQSHFFPDRPWHYLRSRIPLGGLRSYYLCEIKFYHLRFNHLELEDFLAKLHALDFKKVVILERKNTLRKVVSSVIGHREKRFHRKPGEASEMKRVHIDPERIEIDSQSRPLLEFLQEYEADLSNLRLLTNRMDPLELVFEEDIAQDPKHAYQKVCRYLGLTPETPEIRMLRTNPQPLSGIVENFDELRSALQATPYAWMLDA